METQNEFVTRYTEHGQWTSVRAEHAHLPHVTVRWYDGGIWIAGVCAVLPGETPEAAAKRAFGAERIEGGALRGRCGRTVTITACPLFEARPEARVWGSVDSPIEFLK